MFGNITVGQYLPGNSVIHRLDPRIKIVIAVLFIVAIFLVVDVFGYLVAGLFGVMAVLLSGIQPRVIIRGLRPVIFILALTVVLHLFMNQGQPIFSIGPLVATWEGFRLGLFMGTRIVFLILFTSLLTLTTSPVALTDGLERLLKPFQRIGVPAHELAMMMTIALRFIPTLLEEAEKIMKAQMARGADFQSGNLFARAKSLVPLLVPLFVSAFRRADELATAMEARCYRGGKGRTRMKQLVAAPRDIAALLLTVSLVGVMIYLRHRAG